MMNSRELAAHHASQRLKFAQPSAPIGCTGRQALGLIEPLRPLHRESSHSDGKASFRAGIAHTPWQQDQARELVRRRYRYAGYRVPVDAHHCQRSTLVALAVRGLTPIGTLSLWRDTANGLQADKLFGAALDDLRARGARVAEFGRLAFDAPMTFTRLLSPLVHTASALALADWRVTDIVVECHPRHADFYRNALGFNQLSDAIDCPRIGAPAVLLHLSAEHALSLFSRPAGHQRVDALRSAIVAKSGNF